jgi:hypothetical protein
MRAGTCWRLDSATKSRRPDEPSRLACHELACQAHRVRRSKKKSGRRDSNPRQPAWKAGTYSNTARLVQIGLTGRFIGHPSCIRMIDKSCHKAFLGLLTKAFAYFRRQELRRFLTGKSILEFFSQRKSWSTFIQRYCNVVLCPWIIGFD